ncbi:response regulator [Rhodospirillaceae bacterium KN72]|uniref:histidine kinase n=1 Tax=Pacificispira spongiicola TaxID=2729598 RepID=A0A7Y0HFX0_9PROT|nr:response regulator [Pacificispira spongiicola]NMM46295.1 response regulator [Pacificispira spongiicola]
MVDLPFLSRGRHEAAQKDAIDAAVARTRHDMLAAYRAIKATVLTIGADGRVLTCDDGAGLFSEAEPPQRLASVVQALGGTRDIRDTMDMLIMRAEDPSVAGAVGRAVAASDPVIAMPGREDREEETRWLSVSSTGIEGPSDGIAESITDRGAVLLVLQDVSDRQRQADMLDRRVALLNRALDRAPFGLLILDAEGRVRDTNTAFRNLFGGSIDPGTDFATLFAPDDASRIASLLSATRALGSDAHQPPPLDLRIAGGAEERIVTIYANRTMLPDRGLPGVVVHAIDATERKRLEKQFAQSQKMQAVGQLAGGIAHDFNNVLTAIIGFCDLLLQRHQPGDPSFADVMQIQQNANRAAGLTRQLLAFSRQQTIRSQLVDVTDTLAELSNLLRRLLGENIELSMIHGRDLWHIRGDRGQLEQVIINLAVNARDAMERGGRLIIQTDKFVSERHYRMREEVMPPGEYVSISVSDTGMGMEPDVLSHIFEPFYTTKEVGQGTGLGLAMVYGSVSQMGGFVAANSEGLGKGATFSLYLPRATETEGDRADRVDAEDREAVEHDDTGGERILLVEDEDAVRLFSARALRSKGYEVTEARTGEVALEILATASFDLLITDMVMPKVDGATLIREARESRPDLPVICISGYTRESVAKEVAELPAVSFLSKPFSLKQLTRRVRASLEATTRNG